MSVCNFVIRRYISTTAVNNGKRNFKKFMIYNKRGTKIFKEQQKVNPDPEIPIYKRGVRDVGYMVDNKFITVPEMIPELIVPNLKDCELKPYVSYRAAEVTQSEFTAQDLFDVVYSSKIRKDFEEGKLDEFGNPKEPSPEELLTSEEAKLRAEKTGTDIF